MTRFTWLLVVRALKPMGTKIVNLFQIGLPTVHGMTAVTAPTFATIVNVRMAAVTVEWQALVLVVHMTLGAVHILVLSKKWVIGLILMIKIQNLRPTIGHMTLITG